MLEAERRGPLLDVKGASDHQELLSRQGQGKDVVLIIESKPRDCY